MELNKDLVKQVIEENRAVFEALFEYDKQAPVVSLGRRKQLLDHEGDDGELAKGWNPQSLT